MRIFSEFRAGNVRLCRVASPNCFQPSISLPVNPLLTQEPATDPTPLYRMRDGLMAVDLISAAVIHLDLYTWLADHPSTLGAICAQFQIHTRPADVLMTLSNALGLTTCAGGVFHIALRTREHLTKGSPWDLSPYYSALKDRPQTLDMLKVLRTGKPANWGSYDASAWAQAMERDDFATQFTAAMDCRGVYLGRAVAAGLDLSGHRSLLDIAGGSGIYACAIAAKHPEIRATVFEKPPVDRIARNAVEKQGMSDRVDVIAGDMFAEPLPGGFDAHLISNVLHDWEEPTVRTILEKSHAALPSGGLLIIHDAFINADKTGPLPVAQYSALLMHSTEGKCYSLGEIRTYLNALGFEWLDHKPSGADRSFVTARKV